nr:ribonuclease HI family protein [Syntrophomonas palmitatica]
MNTDGACVGNPGPIGIGGIIKFNDQYITICENMGYGTNNEAEYLAIIKAIETVLDLPPGSVLIQSDSQLVVNQVNGIYRIKQQYLAELCNRVHTLIEKYPGTIELKWVSRNQNSEADALASKAAGTPQAVIKNNKVVTWESNYIPDSEALRMLPGLLGSCADGIRKLVSMKENAKFKNFKDLRIGGIDQYSHAKVEFLIQCAAVRFGDHAVDWLKEAVESFDTEYGKKALRWVARGLPPDMALKKVAVDMEVKANSTKKQAS